MTRLLAATRAARCAFIATWRDPGCIICTIDAAFFTRTSTGTLLHVAHDATTPTLDDVEVTFQ